MKDDAGSTLMRFRRIDGSIVSKRWSIRKTSIGGLLITANESRLSKASENRGYHLQVRGVVDSGRGGSATAGIDWDGSVFDAVGMGSDEVADEAVASCCCLAVNSTGIGSVKASSGFGNGPRGLQNSTENRVTISQSWSPYCFSKAPSGIWARHDCSWLIRFIKSGFHDSAMTCHEKKECPLIGSLTIFIFHGFSVAEECILRLSTGFIENAQVHPCCRMLIIDLYRTNESLQSVHRLILVLIENTRKWQTFTFNQLRSFVAYPIEHQTSAFWSSLSTQFR